jgi:hypothetical protein
MTDLLVAHFAKLPDRRSDDLVVQPTERHFQYFNERPPINSAADVLVESNMFSALLALLGFNLKVCRVGNTALFN